MDVLRIALIVCHLAALVILLGGFVVRFVTTRDVTGVMAGAAGALLGTGLLLAAVRAADDLGNNVPKIAVKLAVAAAVFVCALAARRRTGTASPRRNAAQRIAARETAAATGTVLVYATGLLAVVNTAVAVAWT